MFIYYQIWGKNYILYNLLVNLNGYFLTKERGEAIARGNDAVEAAKIVEVKATARVEAERGEKEI